MPYIYYREQCDFCSNRGMCRYEIQTRKVLDSISAIEKNATGVYGSYSFRCDYFDLDKVNYERKNPPECCG